MDILEKDISREQFIGGKKYLLTKEPIERGDLFYNNFMGDRVEKYEKGVDYGIFDPNKCDFDYKATLIIDNKKINNE